MFSNRVIIGTSCFNVNIFFVLCFQLFSFFQMPLCRDVNTQSVLMFSKYYTYVSWCFQLFIFYLAANTVCVFEFSKFCIYVANTICVFKIFLVYVFVFSMYSLFPRRPCVMTQILLPVNKTEAFVTIID